MKSGKPEQTGEKKDKKEERRKKASEGKVGGGTQVNKPVFLFYAVLYCMHVSTLSYRVVRLKPDRPRKNTLKERMTLMMKSKKMSLVRVPLLLNWSLCPSMK